MILKIVVYVLPVLSISAALIALTATGFYVVTLVVERRAPKGCRDELPRAQHKLRHHWRSADWILSALAGRTNVGRRSRSLYAHVR